MPCRQKFTTILGGWATILGGWATKFFLGGKQVWILLTGGPAATDKSVGGRQPYKMHTAAPGHCWLCQEGLFPSSVNKWRLNKHFDF